MLGYRYFHTQKTVLTLSRTEWQRSDKNILHFRFLSFLSLSVPCLTGMDINLSTWRVICKLVILLPYLLIFRPYPTLPCQPYEVMPTSFPADVRQESTALCLFEAEALMTTSLLSRQTICDHLLVQLPLAHQLQTNIRYNNVQRIPQYSCNQRYIRMRKPVKPRLIGLLIRLLHCALCSL